MTSVRYTLEEFRRVIDVSPFTRWTGLELTRFEAGEVEVSLVPREEMRQHHGFTHGAIVGFVADTCVSWAAASVVGDVVTAEYKLNLLSPAVGERLIGRGTVVKAGQRQVVARADVYAVQDGREKIVATALATIARVH